MRTPADALHDPRPGDVVKGVSRLEARAAELEGA